MVVWSSVTGGVGVRFRCKFSREVAEEKAPGQHVKLAQQEPFG